MLLNILAFADTRTSIELPDCKPDLVLLLGDIPSLMTARINKKYSCPKLGVFGNHCHPSNFDDKDIVNIHERIVTINGCRIAGFEGAPRYKEQKFGQHTESEVASFISTITHPVDIFVAHSNPVYESMQDELDHTHRGFLSFNHLMAEKKVKHFFHGHLHDPFQIEIDQTKVYSVYPYLNVNLSI